MIDSASNVNIINPGLCAPNHVFPARVPLQALSGTKICREFARIKPFQCFEGLINEMVFLVLKFHNIYDGLIGIPILKSLNAIIDFEEMKLKFGSNQIPLFFFQKLKKILIFNIIQKSHPIYAHIMLNF